MPRKQLAIAGALLALPLWPLSAAAETPTPEIVAEWNSLTYEVQDPAVPNFRIWRVPGVGTSYVQP